MQHVLRTCLKFRLLPSLISKDLGPQSAPCLPQEGSSVPEVSLSWRPPSEESQLCSCFKVILGGKDTGAGKEMFETLVSCFYKQLNMVPQLYSEYSPEMKCVSERVWSFQHLKVHLQISCCKKISLVRANRVLDFGTLLGTGGSWQPSILASMTLSCDHRAW